MRDQPTLVHGVAREAPAQMVVDPPLANASEGVLDGFEKPCVFGAQAGAPEHFEDCGLRKFGSAAQTAVDLVEHVADLHGGRIKLLQAHRNFVCRSRLLGEPGKARDSDLLCPAEAL